MNLKLTLIALLIPFNLQAEPILNKPVNSTYEKLRTLENKITNINLQGFDLDLKSKIIRYPSLENNLYIQIQKDHNGKPLYFLTYSFNSKDVSIYFKKLQRTLRGRADKEIKNY